MPSPWGRLTGGHVNPAITLAMWRYGRTPGSDVAPYIAGQLIGSLLGIAAGRLVWGPVFASPAVDYAVIRPAPGWSWAAVALIEAAPMFVIVAFGTQSGGIANPAREFGPALLSGPPSLLQVYLLAPPLGAIAATAFLNRFNSGAARYRGITRAPFTLPAHSNRIRLDQQAEHIDGRD